MIKDGKQHALGDYEAITKTGLDIDQILKSYNQAVQDRNQTKFEKEAAPVLKKEVQVEETEAKRGATDLIVAEEKQYGAVKFRDVLNYLNFSMGCWALVWFVLVNVLCSASELGTTYWVSYWTE